MTDTSLTLSQAYRMRWKRRRLLWRSFQSRRELTLINDVTGSITPGDVLVFAVVRNEAERLDRFLNHYRDLGVAQFLIIDNGSDDGTFERLQDQPDLSLWQTHASYKESRFGINWITWLHLKYGHGHWCLTVDADEFLVYDGSTSHDLNDLTNRLDGEARRVFGALMLDLYPRGPIGSDAAPEWFDNGPFRAVRQKPMLNLWIQGGARERVFFPDDPKRSPTLNKIPLIKWNRRFAYVNSTHSILPPKLNLDYGGPGSIGPHGALLHHKFESTIVSKSETERHRAEHFGNPQDLAGYYDAIAAAPDMWSEDSQRYENADQLVKLGLISAIPW